jgi:hypothetical protein
MTMSQVDAADVFLNPSRDKMPSVQNERPPSKDLKNAVLNLMVVEMNSESSMKSSNGESTYGLITKLVKKRKLQYPWLNRNIFNYYLKTTQPPSSVTVRSHPSTISDMTESDPSNEEDQHNLNTENEAPAESSSALLSSSIRGVNSSNSTYS